MATFVAKFGGIPVGRGTGIVLKSRAPTPEIELATTPPDEPLWHIRGHGRSIRPISFVYKLEDSFESWMFPRTLLPHRWELIMDESSERSAWRILFDHSRGCTHLWRSRSFYRRNPDRVRLTERYEPLRPESFDLLSILFYMRCIDVRVGQEFRLPLFNSGKNLDAYIRVEGIEKIKTIFGKREAIRAKIEAFYGPEKKTLAPYTAWVSNDRRRIPLRFIADLPFGSLQANLIGYRPTFAASPVGELDHHAVSQVVPSDRPSE